MLLPILIFLGIVVAAVGGKAGGTLGWSCFLGGLGLAVWALGRFFGFI